MYLWSFTPVSMINADTTQGMSWLMIVDATQGQLSDEQTAFLLKTGLAYENAAGVVGSIGQPLVRLGMGEPHSEVRIDQRAIIHPQLTKGLHFH